MAAPLHPQQEARLASLHAYAILDTPRERPFDRLVYMAAQILRTPMAMISFVAADRQWFKAVVGVDLRETRLDDGFCPFAILQDEPLVVPDARDDARFAAMTVVTGPPFVRFYAGVRLLSDDGLPLGTLCAVDTKPRSLTPDQIGGLRALARDAEGLLFRVRG